MSILDRISRLLDEQADDGNEPSLILLGLREAQELEAELLAVNPGGGYPGMLAFDPDVPQPVRMLFGVRLHIMPDPTFLGVLCDEAMDQ